MGNVFLDFNGIRQIFETSGALCWPSQGQCKAILASCFRPGGCQFVPMHVRVICVWMEATGQQTRRCVIYAHTHVYTNIHTHRGPMGKNHHTWSQRSRLCKQLFLISVTLLFNFLFVPNWKSETAVFSAPPFPRMTQFFDIKHGLAMSKISLCRHEAVQIGGGGTALPPQRPLISKLLMPCLYVRTHWSVSLLNVKCITCHPHVPVSSSRGLSAHKHTHRVESGHFEFHK